MVISAKMLSHCVYVWKKSNPDDADTVMYVGASAIGVRRFAGHHALPSEYAEEDYIELFLCRSREEAADLEAQMIRELKPQLNKHIPIEKLPLINTRKPMGSAKVSKHQSSQSPRYFFKNDKKHSQS